MSANPMRDAALDYVARGYSVLPLHSAVNGSCSCTKGSACESRGKHPRTKHGLNDATTDAATIRAWWEKWPDANIGVNMGVSGLAAADVDVRGEKAGLQTWETVKAEHGSIVENTAIVITPTDGMHAWFEAGPYSIASGENALGMHVDVKAEGGYLVAPPSSIDGVPYRWKEGHGLDRLALIPESLARAMSAPKQRLRQRDADAVSERIPAGKRHSTLVSLAGAMRNRGAGEGEIAALLHATAAERCDPPYADADDIDAIARDAAGWSIGEAPRVSVPASPPDEAAAEPDALRAWAAQVAALPPVDRQFAIEAQRDALKAAGVSSPMEMIKAALAEVASANDEGEESPTGVLLADAEPCHEEVDGAVLLDDIAGTFSRFVALPEAAAETLALYCLLTFVCDAFFVLPILAVTSAVKRSGKTITLSVLLKIASRALPTSNITASAIFRVVDKYHPTLVIDEVDSFLAGNEEMRGILNAGHTRPTAFVIRNVAVGDGFEPTQFSVWCPKVVAGIGKLPGTLEDRSIVVSARRRTRGERVERLRQDRLDELEPLPRRCRRWADDNVAALGTADPSVPDLSSDRAADNWRPLLAIADAAGGEWPERARRAAVILSGDADESDGASVLLLEDMRDLFAMRGIDRLKSAEVARALEVMEERPWPEWQHGRPISARQVAALLGDFAIKPKAMKFPDGVAHRGYRLSDFEDAFERYTDPSPPAASVTSVTSLQNGTFPSVTSQTAVTHEKPSICSEVTAVTDESPQVLVDVSLSAAKEPEDVPVPVVGADLFRHAVTAVVASGEASATLIAERCSCSPEAAEATLAELEKAGVVSPANGDKARAVAYIGEGEEGAIANAFAARRSAAAISRNEGLAPHLSMSREEMEALLD